MTTISANMILDSVSPQGIRLSTMHLRYPRFIHAEFMTHRVFSRNARSSRAVPIKTMIQECIDDPVIPLHWGAAQAGMQAYRECQNGLYEDGQFTMPREVGWLKARDAAVEWAEKFMHAGYAKQLVNRLLEPFLHIDVLVSATNWNNFLALRDHEAAEPHIQILARAMRDCMDCSEPKLMQPGEWHLPYIREEDHEPIVALASEATGVRAGALTDNPVGEQVISQYKRRVSVARCARLSYAPFDGNATIEAEVDRYDRLMGALPIHASPAEHQATPDNWFDGVNSGGRYARWQKPEMHGNFTGWRQLRKMIPGEHIQ